MKRIILEPKIFIIVSLSFLSTSSYSAELAPSHNEDDLQHQLAALDAQAKECQAKLAARLLAGRNPHQPATQPTARSMPMTHAATHARHNSHSLVRGMVYATQGAPLSSSTGPEPFSTTPYTQQASDQPLGLSAPAITDTSEPQWAVKVTPPQDITTATSAQPTSSALTQSPIHQPLTQPKVAPAPTAHAMAPVVVLVTSSSSTTPLQPTSTPPPNPIQSLHANVSATAHVPTPPPPLQIAAQPSPHPLPAHARVTVHRASTRRRHRRQPQKNTDCCCCVVC